MQLKKDFSLFNIYSKLLTNAIKNMFREFILKKIS